ncbi:MAG: PadR family transcriptional regulator [Acidimicrobiales bacterium]
MLDLAILGLLEERGELHGYEIRRQLRDGLGLLANVSFGSLYPALARLETAGAVEAIDPAPAPAGAGASVPPTGSLSGEWAVLRSRRGAGVGARGGRSRKAYRITGAGRRLFTDLLCRADGGDDARSFGLRLAFAGHLPPVARLGLLERRRAHLAQRLAEAQGSGGGERLGTYARSVAEHATDALEHDIGWLDRLLDAERATARTAVSPRSGEPATAGTPAGVADRRPGPGRVPARAGAGRAAQPERARRRHDRRHDKETDT